MAKIFVSYSRRESAIAEKIAHALQEAGQTFLDRNLKPGEDWRKAVETAIKISDAVLVVIASPDTVGSSWTGYEIGMAEALGKPIMLLTSDRHSTPMRSDRDGTAKDQFVERFIQLAPRRYKCGRHQWSA